MFALIWGIGAFLDLSDQRKFDSFLREKLSKLDLPTSESEQDTTVFDFVVSSQGKH